MGAQLPLRPDQLVPEGFASSGPPRHLRCSTTGWSTSTPCCRRWMTMESSACSFPHGVDQVPGCAPTRSQTSWRAIRTDCWVSRLLTWKAYGRRRDVEASLWRSWTFVLSVLCRGSDTARRTIAGTTQFTQPASTLQSLAARRSGSRVHRCLRSRSRSRVPNLDRVALDFPEPKDREWAHRASVERGDDRVGLEARQRLYRRIRVRASVATRAMCCRGRSLGLPRGVEENSSEVVPEGFGL